MPKAGPIHSLPPSPLATPAGRRWVLFLALAAALTSGCALPRATVGLDEVLRRKGVAAAELPDYRCTMGAHRGASEAHVENTEAALLAADQDPRFAFIEFDVQYTADGRIVLYHDARMLRLSGSPRAVNRSTFAEMTAVSGGTVAAYDAVIGRLTKRLNIEIKSQGDPAADRRLVDAVIADLRARERDQDVLISSIAPEVVAYVNRAYPRMPTGQIFWLTSSAYLHLDPLTRRLYDEVERSRADYLLLHVANLRNVEDLLRLKPRGKTIAFWDFDDTMYLVHKDYGDRLWGNSNLRELWARVRYRILSPFHRRTGTSTP